MKRLLTSPSHWFLFCLLALGFLLASGCKKSPETTQNGPNGQSTAQANGGQATPQTGPRGEAILRDVLARYDAASTYSDKAVLYLTYVIHGQRIQEPQPWSTSFVRSATAGTTGGSSRLAAKLFNSQIVCDRNLLSCYVYDIETANLDNQHLLIPYENQLPINQLYRGSIARHFIGGYSELPLDETDLVSNPKLIPAPISLLTNQVRNGWLQNPTQVERLADQTVDDRDCYVVRCLSQGMTADVWVDKQTSTLMQMSLPLKLLDAAVIVAPEITEVVLLAKFHEARLDGNVDPKEMTLRSYKNATPVRRFVQLPEKFPSDLIGELAPDFEVFNQANKPIARADLSGKVTALLWVNGRNSYHSIQQLDEMSKSFPADRFHFASVYSDTEVLQSPTGKPEPSPELKRIISQSTAPTYYDPQLHASAALGAKLIPSVIVLDGDSKIQYARALGDKSWPAELRAVIERVGKGDDVATEMQNDYVRYLESYHQQLVTVSAADLIGQPKQDVTTVSSNYNRSSIRLRPQKTWLNSDFTKPGNIAVIGLNDRKEIQTGPAYTVFDGWRTVVEIDNEGQTIRRVQLELPDGEAANLIRVGRQSETGSPLFAVFSALGKSVYLFDQHWKPMTAYPAKNVEHAGVRDCRLYDVNGDGETELIVAFDDENGIHVVDPKTGSGERASKAIATSLVGLGEEVVIAGQGKIGMLKTGLTNVEETELDFQRVASLGNRHLCGLGVTNTGNWNAVGFDTELKRIWTLSIGSQFFESDLDPVAVAQIDGQSGGSNSELLWAIADTDDIIHLVSGSGKWLGDFQSETRIHGLALESREGITNLIVCNEKGIECWNLNLESSSSVPALPASSKQ